MSILRLAAGWGLVFLGTAVMLMGYLISLTNFSFMERANMADIASQLTEIGFMLVAIGVIASLIVFVLRELRAI
jgi:hypothetical protein